MHEMQQHDSSILALFDPRKAEITGLRVMADFEFAMTL
jgi:hypothetical protein